MAPLERLAAAYRDRLAGAPERPGIAPVVAYVGTDVPLELLDAAGVRAVRVCGDPAGRPSPEADAVAERGIDGMARSQLARLVDGVYAGTDRVLVSHDTEGATRVFHYAAECRHLGIGRVPEVEVVDVLHLPHETSTAYTHQVVRELRIRIGELAGRAVDDEALAAAIARAADRRAALDELAAVRRGPSPRLSGTEALVAIGAAATLDVDEHAALVRELVDAVGGREPLAGRRVLLTGSAHDHPAFYEALEGAGAVIVGEDHDWGAAWFGVAPDTADDLDLALARRVQDGPPRSGRHPVAARAAHTAEAAVAAGAEVVLAVLRRGDDGPPWDVPAQRAALAAHGIDLVEVALDGYGAEHVDAAVERAVAALGLAAPAAPGRDPVAEAVAEESADGSVGAPPASSPAPTSASSSAGPAAPAAAAPSARPRADDPRPPRPKGLEASAAATAHQRQWFADMREQVAAGAPLAVVNADAPHEVLRAMGIPYVVNQWWASVCAAKQQGPRYLEVLRRLGYPDDVEAYSAMALGSALDPDRTDAPWGGLPPVDLLVAETTTDATAKIFEVWAEAQGAELALLESTVAPLRPRRWFESIHDDWERVLGSRRIDLMVEEIRSLVDRVTARTGRRLDEVELERVMALANEQAEWNARTRDLIARTSPAPIGVADAIPATMIPQWHRGSEWGRDAARHLYDEVSGLVEAGHGVVPDEQARLMWIGRGLWFDMGFYQRIQERHGAVFVWSMYLAIAADAYLRRGGDPLRTLAGRFCGFADLYNTPPWSSEWYAAEAVRNRIDGVVHLTTDAVRGTHFITRAIEAAGVPVLEISGSNVDARAWEPDAVDAAVEEFLGGRALPQAAERRAREKV